MKINLNDLLEEGRRYEGEEPSSILEVEDDPDMRARGPIRYEIDAYLVSDMLIVQGRLQVPMAFRCSRCGEFYDTDVAARRYQLSFEIQRFNAQPKEKSKKKTKNELEASSDRDSVLTMVERGSDFVDLTGDIRESILLRFPGYPVCAGP